MVAVVAIALYANTFGHSLALDDVAAISQNLFVQEGLRGIPDLLKTEFWHFSNISLGYYRPLSLITFAVEKEIFNADPNVSHVINALLYGLTGFTLTCLVQKWLPGRVVVSTLAALLFVAHPVHTEVVANIKGRDELLSFLFIISMLYAGWRYLETRRTGFIWLSAGSLYLAFLSKESSVVSLALIPLMTYFFARRSVWQSLRALWPFLLVAVAFFIQKKLMIGTLSGKPPVDWANYPYALQNTEFWTTFKFFAYYIRLLILPHPLVYDYSYNVIPSGSATDPLSLLGLASVALLAWLAWRGFRQRTLWGFGLLWFFVSMAPGLGFVFSRGGILAERFLYAPVFGFIITVLAVGEELLRRYAPPVTGADWRRYTPLLAFCGVVLSLYAFKTVDRNRAWKDNFTLFTTDEKLAPNSCQVNRHAANEWINKCMAEKDPALKQQYFNRTIYHLKRSTEIYPGFGEAYFSIAYAYQKLSPKIDSAIYYYKQTIRASSSYAPAYNNLGVIYQAQRRYHLASYYFFSATQANPAYADGRNNYENLKKGLNLAVQVLPDSLQHESVPQLLGMPPSGALPTVRLPTPEAGRR
mgnify:CR=1 FL=1